MLLLLRRRYREEMAVTKELPLNKEMKATMEPRRGGQGDDRGGEEEEKWLRNYATLRMCTKPQVRSSHMSVVYFITLTG